MVRAIGHSERGVGERVDHDLAGDGEFGAGGAVDQAELFVRRRLKPVWLDEAEIRANLEREVRPGERLR